MQPDEMQAPHPHRVALSGAVILLWFALAGLLWMMWPGRGNLLVWHSPRDAGAQETRLGRAIQSSMAPHIPDPKERKVIWSWIAGTQQRHLFYRAVWPILQARCHKCHGSFHRPQGAIPLTRLAHVLPLSQVKATAHRQLWSFLARQLPLAGGLLLVLALLLGTTPKRRILDQVLIAMAWGGLLGHGIGTWLRLSHAWGISLSAIGLVVVGTCVTALAVVLMRRWWQRS